MWYCISLFSVISTSAVDLLERLVSKITSYVKGGRCTILTQLNSASLPPLVSVSTVECIAVCGSVLQSQFDCCISPVPMSSKELSWMVAMFAGFVPGNHLASVSLSVLDHPLVNSYFRY